MSRFLVLALCVVLLASAVNGEEMKKKKNKSKKLSISKVNVKKVVTKTAKTAATSAKKAVKVVNKEVVEPVKKVVVQPVKNVVKKVVNSVKPADKPKPVALKPKAAPTFPLVASDEYNKLKTACYQVARDFDHLKQMWATFGDTEKTIAYCIAKPAGHNCMTKEVWTQEKKDWCCKEKQIGCPIKEHNCMTKEVWTQEKKDWCCKEKQIGCPIVGDKQCDKTTCSFESIANRFSQGVFAGKDHLEVMRIQHSNDETVCHRFHDKQTAGKWHATGRKMHCGHVANKKTKKFDGPCECWLRGEHPNAKSGITAVGKSEGHRDADTDKYGNISPSPKYTNNHDDYTHTEEASKAASHKDNLSNSKRVENRNKIVQ